MSDTELPIWVESQTDTKASGQDLVPFLHVPNETSSPIIEEVEDSSEISPMVVSEINSSVYPSRPRKTIGQALDRFLDDTMEAIDPLIQKYAPMVQQMSRMVMDDAIHPQNSQNLTSDSILSSLQLIQTTNPDGGRDGGQVPLVCEEQRIITPFGEIHMMAISGSSSKSSHVL